MSVHRTKDGRHYVKYYLPGQRTRPKKKYFGRGPVARIKAEKWDLNRKEKKQLGRPVQDEPTLMTFRALAHRYMEQHPLSENSYDAIDSALINWILPAFGKQSIADLSMADLSDMDAAMIKKDLALSTRNRYRSYARAICEWGRTNELIPANPFAAWKPNRKKEGKAPDLITDDELRAIWAQAPAHLRWTIFCMVNLGVRPGRSELLAIKISDVDFTRGGVWVARSKTHSPRELIPTPSVFLEAVSNLLTHEPTRKFLIEYPKRPGQKMTSIKTAWWNTLRRAGIYQENAKPKAHGYLKQTVRGQQRRLRLYDLRHLYATLLLQNGADIKAVSELIGHSSPTMTMSVYYHLLDRQKREAVQKLTPPIGTTFEDYTPIKAP